MRTRPPAVIGWVLMLMVACFPVEQSELGVAPDEDGDNSNVTVDCNDRDSSIHPGADETCNGIDDDCDGETDNGIECDSTSTPVGDDDDTTASGDDDASQGDDDVTTTPASTTPPEDTPTPGDDDGSTGDDDEATTQPPVSPTPVPPTSPPAETPGDDDDTSTPGDDDTSQGDDDTSPVGTTPPDSTTPPGGDDDDDGGTATPPGATTSPDVSPTPEISSTPTSSATPVATPTVSPECVERPEFCIDNDADGLSELDGDCDDADAQTYPGAPEICDAKDNDCDQVVDEDYDQDGDGTSDCVDDDGDSQTENEGDCEDSDPYTYAGALETCNGLDDDCDGEIDEDVQTTYYLDVDSDGYGSTGTSACTQLSGYVSVGGDCNDADVTIHPYQAETCDGIDSNCSGDEEECTLLGYTVSPTPYSSYPDSGNELTDGAIGTSSFSDPAHVGWANKDELTGATNPTVTATFEFGGERVIDGVELFFLADYLNWIFVPDDVLVEGSIDGTTWEEIGSSLPQDASGPAVAPVSVPTAGSGVFVRVTMTNTPSTEAPAWWTFLSEVVID